jgi:pSer/pThr/pTyr-binding forkhead associated (FHA) protein
LNETIKTLTRNFLVAKRDASGNNTPTQVESVKERCRTRLPVLSSELRSYLESATMSVTMHVVQGRPKGKALPLPDGEYYIGRGVECHIRPNSDWVSRQHCLLRVGGGAASIRDLGSRNGTLVNGELISGERVLAHGDQIEVGPLVLEIRLKGNTQSIVDSEAARLLRERPTSMGSTEDHPSLPSDSKAESGNVPQ